MIAPATTNAVRMDRPSRRRFAVMTAARRDASLTYRTRTPHVSAIEEELRAKLVAEVRRETQQFVTTFSAEVEALRQTLADQGVHAEDALQGIQGLVANLTDQLQSVVRGQATPPIVEMGLEKSLEKYCQNLCNQTPLEMSFESHVNERHIDPSTALTVFRIAQDSLDHAAHHHKPNFVSVKLDQQGMQLQLRIEDLADPGLSSHDVVDNTERQYFQRMEERMADCAGQLQISRGPGSTVVFLELPLNAPRGARAA
ncbi:MAG: hypothetical protein EXS18_06575 [Verrucomicrobiae bacterium]|nr:hypothetical protein [Verrucomicrobiae bacterium]